MKKIEFGVFIQSPNQLEAVIKYNISTVYIPFDLFYINKLSHQIITDIHCSSDINVYIVLPEILRLRDQKYLDYLKEFLLLGKADGVLVRNLEEIGFLKSIEAELNSEYISLNGKIDGFTALYIQGDYSLYNWNKSALAFNYEFCNRLTAPLELSIHEIKELDDSEIIIPIYGKTPLMVSSNCIKKTCGECNKCNDYSFDRRLNDRKNKSQIIYSNCIHCFNKLYNSIPNSYHKQMYDLIKAGFKSFRLDFTNENNEVINDILSYYIIDERAGQFPLEEYTTGHILKGAI